MHPPQKYTVSVKKVEQLSPEVKLFTLAFPLGTHFHFQAGQFIMLNLYDETKKLVRRAYSIASSPQTTTSLQLCIKIYPDGQASKIFSHLQEGASLDIEGPYGKFVLKNTHPELVFIGAGAGIAPLRSMIHHLFETHTTKYISLFFGFRSEHDFLFKDEIEKLKKLHPHFSLILSVSQPHTKSWQHEVSRIHTVLPKYLKSTLPEKEFYLCGPPAMIQDTKKVLIGLGFKTEQIYSDAWG